MKLTLGNLRLKAVWVLIVPFFYFARPTPSVLAVGAGLALLGLAIRAWAAGTIVKDRELATAGPYSLTRNPLYLGSLLIGIGVTWAGAQPLFLALFLAFFLAIYGRTMRVEAKSLGERFGDAYQSYAAAVPLLFPWRLPYKAGAGAGAGFSFQRYRGNREYEALLGFVGALALLLAKMLWLAA